MVSETFLRTTKVEAFPRSWGGSQIHAVAPMMMRFHKIAQPGSVNLRHILPIHNFAINSKNLFVNIFWTFNFCVEESYEGTHLAVGGNLDWRCHFKHVSLKQSLFYHCQTSTARM